MPLFRRRHHLRQLQRFDQCERLDDDGALNRFWDWCDEGCPHHPDDLERATIARAVMSIDTCILSTLSTHNSGWVRLAVAMNPQTPPSVQWGNGTTDHFGLTSDSEPWVRAVSLMRMPRPPAELIDAPRE